MIASKIEQPGGYSLAELIGRAWLGGAAILGSALSNQLGQNATVRSEVGQLIGPANLPPMGGTGKRRRSVSSRGRGKGRGPHRGRGASVKRRRRQ